MNIAQRTRELPDWQRRAVLDAACSVVMAYAAATRGAHSRETAEQRVRMGGGRHRCRRHYDQHGVTGVFPAIDQA